MKNPRNIKKTSAGNPGRVNQILRQTARAVVYLVSALAVVAVVAVVASCQSSALNCNAPGVVCDL